MRIITHKPKPVPAVREFVFTEQEALFVRDLIGGTNSEERAKAIIGSYNKGKWTEETAKEMGKSLYDQLINVL